MTSKKKIIGPFCLLLTALLWGIAFVAQAVGMENVEPFTFNGVRTFLGAVALLPVLLVLQLAKKKKALSKLAPAERKKQHRLQLFAGVVCGVVLFVASNLQQQAFLDTSAGKIAFITALYILFVPIIGLFLHKKVRPIMWLCFAVGLIGLYMLCVTDGFAGINKGDWFALACSVVFAVHILVIDYFASRVDVILMSFTQFLVAGVLALLCAFLFEEPSWVDIRAAAVPILYTAVFSCSAAYTLQMVGQKYTEASVATLLLCMESVFGVLSSAILLHEQMALREVLGCVLMFIAIIVSQLPEKKRKTESIQ